MSNKIIDQILNILPNKGIYNWEGKLIVYCNKESLKIKLKELLKNI